MPSNAIYPKIARAARTLGELSFPPSRLFLTLRVLGWWALLRLLRPFLSVSRLVSLASPENPSARLRPPDVLRCLGYVDSSGLWSRDGDCLPRALTCRRFLAFAGLDSSLMIGFSRDPGRSQGHSWIEVDGRPFLESDLIAQRYIPALVLSPGDRELVPTPGKI